MGERIAESRRRHAEALEMGGEQAVAAHRAAGRLPVRERIALLLDEGSWCDLLRSWHIHCKNPIGILKESFETPRSNTQDTPTRRAPRVVHD